MNEKNYPNLSLAHKNAEVYSQVDGLSLQNLFYVYNEYFPNCLMFNRASRDGKFLFKTAELLDYLIKNTPEDEKMETIKYVTRDLGTGERTLGFCVLLHKSNIFARIESSITESYVLFANDNEDALDKFEETIMKFYVAQENKKNTFFTIGSNAQGFTLIENSVNKVEHFDINKQYNDDFAAQDTKIQKFLKEDGKSGLIILHGAKGTGKSTYIRNLINTNPEKRFVYVHAGLVEMLGSHQFQSFLLSLTNHVIILEDCESALKDRKTNAFGASSVSILLNMSDGLLSDGLGIKFICTFNEDIKDMDEAITRKGRLTSKYEFKPLIVEKSNTLLKEVFVRKQPDQSAIFNECDGYKLWSCDENGEIIIEDIEPDEFGDEPVLEPPTTKTPMSLADIYNFDEESYETKRKSII